jgi:hypothetical protein
LNATAPPIPAAPRAIRKRDLMAILRAATLDRAAFDARIWSVADAQCLEAAAAVIRRGLAAAPAARPRVPRSEWLERELTRRADAALSAALAEVIERTCPGD